MDNNSSTFRHNKCIRNLKDHGSAPHAQTKATNVPPVENNVMQKQTQSSGYNKTELTEKLDEAVLSRLPNDAT
jgi:hypothetical protein